MSFDIGINFRATAGFVMDGANETYCEGSESSVSPGTYPTSRAGVVLGWTYIYDTVGSRDRSTSVDHRLAGLNNVYNVATNRFRLDLPAPGTYTVHLALGDVDYPGTYTADLLDSDGATVIRPVASGVALPAGSFIDATGVLRTASAWPTAEQGVDVTVSGTSIYVRLAQGTSIAHFRVFSADGAPATGKTPIHLFLAGSQ